MSEADEHRPTRGTEDPEAAAPGQLPAVEGTGGRPDPEDAWLDEDLDSPFGFPEERGSAEDGRVHRVFSAPGGVINLGSIDGDPTVGNSGGPRGTQGHARIESRQGPIPAPEILSAAAGFAEPEWFRAALQRLDSRLLLLAGAPGSGRRTAALNLLHRHSGSFSLRAVDGDVHLADWRPAGGSGARGYLVDGLAHPESLRHWLIGDLRSRLEHADARMVIVLPDVPEVVRIIKRELHLTPVLCEPPSPSAVFTKQLERALPDPAERDRLVAALEPGLLDELLGKELLPAHVVELVDELAQGADAAAVRQRLSFLAEEEVPSLLMKLRDEPDGLAFLLSACVFEGLDQRIVQEEADRLLHLAEGRLDAHTQGTGEEKTARRNPHFVFRRALDDRLYDIGARPLPPEVHASYGYQYAVEPVRFTRHGQADAVLRHVWRQYGPLSRLLTDWLKQVAPERELTVPVGRVMGMAARWGGGRRALAHLSELAREEKVATRRIAAHALGIAAQDPVLAGEVSHRLRVWSGAKSPLLRSTVGYACATEYGVARPERALSLLRQLATAGESDQEHRVERAVTEALEVLFVSGSRTVVLHRLAEWTADTGSRSGLALRAFTQLLGSESGIGELLLEGGEPAELVTALARRALNDEERFPSAGRALLLWCRMAVWDEQRRYALEALLSALAQEMQHGVFRLFVTIDRYDAGEVAGRDVARGALAAWRNGAADSGGTAYQGRTV